MRGTIEVSGVATRIEQSTPRYVHFDIDIDTPHPAENLPVEIPQSSRGELWASLLPAYALTPDTYWSHSPSQLWTRLRAEKGLAYLSDSALWDSRRLVMGATGNSRMLSHRGRLIYRQECAACHGETGKGDGVMVRDLMPFSYSHGDFGHGLMQPPDFSDPAHMLGAPPALIEGKLLRGGMGTGMPLYGSIYTQKELEALVSYVYTFIFPVD